MQDKRRPIRLIELWRIPAAIALVLCAIAARLALGAIVPHAVSGGNALSTLEAAMVICGPGSPQTPLAPRPAPRGPSFDDQLLLDIAEAAMVLPPVGVALPPAPVLISDDQGSALWRVLAPRPPHHIRPAPRAPPRAT